MRVEATHEVALPAPALGANHLDERMPVGAAPTPDFRQREHQRSPAVERLAFGRANGPACEECLVTQVLRTRLPASHDITVIEPDGERIVRITASPINDLAGRAQEVIITFQEAGSRGHSAAA